MNKKDSIRGKESVSVKELYESCKERFNFELVAGQEGLEKIIAEKSLNRPALALTGYFRHFGHKRIQLFGAGEMAYLRDQTEEDQLKTLTAIAQRHIPCIIVSRNLAPTKAMVEIARAYRIPLLRTPSKSKDFSVEITLVLEEHFAPRIAVHGTLMDVKGIGTLLRGKSGVGKSECALKLIQMGQSLVSDDLTYFKLVNESQIIGHSSELSQGYMECRGLGIINIAELFGIRSIRTQKRLDLVVTFTEWFPGMDEERTGLEQDYYSILGIDIPHVEIPVKPGRDMAHLVEVAAMVQALKLIGHNSADEFNQRLIAYMQKNAPAH